MTTITLAKTAGFCFGVDRAVKLCERLLAEGKHIVTLGPIIHNETVVDALARKGCAAVDRVEDTPAGATLVIRSHGVPQSVYDECARRGIPIADATCPYVAKIHRIVAEWSGKGHMVFIAGDAPHPEVQGIVGHSAGETLVFSDFSALQILLEGADLSKNAILVAQTTFNLTQYEKCVELLKKRYTNLRIFDTICNATRARQCEAEQLALQSDVCFVIGGRHSSNTKKLCDVCGRHARTYWIEGRDELEEQMLVDAKSIGVTAGASTPSALIEEVLTQMSDMIKDEDFNFEQALEESLKLVHRGQRVEGVVTAIHPNEIVVDIGTKQTGFIPLDELSDDTSAKPEDIVKVGDKLNLLVTKVQDLEGFVTLSKKRVDSEKGLEEIAKGVEEGTVFDAYITEAVNKGLVAMVKGVRIFIPASQATLRRGEPYEQLVRTHQNIKILEVTPERRRAIGSIRAVLDVENEKKRAEFWANAEVGKKYTGAVKSLTSYGAFVDLGGVDGMIHISELSWSRVKSPADVLKVGDVVEVYIKDIDAENKKISLGYRKEEDNPWHKITEYPMGSVFEAPVVSLTKFGAFVRILPGIDGLVHISEMGDGVKNPADVVKMGDIVHVRLIGVDAERKRVSLTMRTDGEAPDTVVTKAQELAAHTAKAAGEAAEDVKHAAAEAADALRAKADEASEKAAAIAAIDAQDALQTAKETAEDAGDALKAAGKAAAKKAKELSDKAAPALEELGDQIADKAKELSDKAKDAFDDVKDKLDGDKE
ncbi:MAG: bifunctional 4-hydroxy-3-methylbut-2-enyl diphosphate reductase/30S ribosomal protein S1 [Oscillospiraceae bacterium]|nr:bifunctional 4-hydroxy-3-methylbut-2-enyl diphosphate reductase/30S ribosomal protein S1 [Oscillospiraceae bacterium]